MAEYRIRETGEIITNLALQFPNTSLPIALTPNDYDVLGVDPIFEGPHASPTTLYEYSYRDGVEELNGKWFTKYSLGPIFNEYTDDDGILHTVEEQQAEYKNKKDEAQWTIIRIQRNALLQQTDWICARSVDTGESVSDEWKTYRQALRDITNQTDPFNIVWPIFRIQT
jgi:hypothetical protein